MIFDDHCIPTPRTDEAPPTPRQVIRCPVDTPHFQHHISSTLAWRLRSSRIDGIGVALAMR
ncbi:MAG TPA: hypothetical protein VNA15_06860, partial [Candidatus Angelobacter sp.]|nr:hypothetical protein [Candidatus Angelobacter sp.]